MLVESIQELESRSLARVASAGTAEEVEAVRVEALGRKSGFSQFSKEMAKLLPEEKARVGKQLNSAKQKVEEAIETRNRQFAELALRTRLDSEWVDLTLAAPGARGCRRQAPCDTWGAAPGARDAGRSTTGRWGGG